VGFWCSSMCQAGALQGSPFANKNQVQGFLVCTFYTVQKLQGGRLSAGAGCSVIRAGFVAPCQPVALSGRVCVCVFVA